MDTDVLFVVYLLVASVVIGVLFKHVWTRHQHRAIQRKWTERERLLDHQLDRPRPRATRHEVFARRARPARTRGQDARGLDPVVRPEPAVGVDARGPIPVVTPEPAARVLFIVARGQRRLVEFLHKDFAAEEAEGVMEILMDRRQSPPPPGARRHAGGWLRDPDRNQAITTELREIGWALVRQPAPLRRTAPAR